MTQPGSEQVISREEAEALLREVDRLKRFVVSFSEGVSTKLDALEKDLSTFEAENERLMMARDGLAVERDAVVGLVARMAKALGYSVGVQLDGERPGQVAIDLPAGQVSWEIAPTEAHLFEGLPAYEQKVEDLEVEEKYARVMNPGI